MLKSHPLGVRELKLRGYRHNPNKKKSHPLGVRELKPNTQYGSAVSLDSRTL